MFSSKKSAEAKETEYDIDNVVFSKWRITKFIGRGSFGRVFQIDRIDGLLSESSALKVITVPRDEEELQSLRSGGMSTAQAKKYLEGMANDVIREVGIMSKLKGTTNIVSYEDCEKIPHENGIGWDILIRMELLNPLLRYACEHPFSRRDIAKLGIDICKALELCQKNNIIHRDVKPENIFVSENGDFKLGDFGISRSFEHTAAASTRVGTVNYMAPEVFNGERKYGFSVDTYSLGLVLYRLINKNRLPFLPPAPEGFLPRDQEAALARRMAGEPVPSPYYFQGRLPEIVLRACTPDVEKRFSSPTEMRRALETIPDNPSDSLLIYPDEDTLKNLREIYFPDDTELIDSPAPPPPEPDPSPRSDKTARLFTEPESAPVPPPPEPNPSPKPERPKKPIGVFAAVGLCAVAAAVGLFMTLHSRNVTDAGEVSAPPSQSSVEPSPSVSSLQLQTQTLSPSSSPVKVEVPAVNPTSSGLYQDALDPDSYYTWEYNDNMRFSYPEALYQSVSAITDADKTLDGINEISYEFRSDKKDNCALTYQKIQGEGGISEETMCKDWYDERMSALTESAMILYKAKSPYPHYVITGYGDSNKSWTIYEVGAAIDGCFYRMIVKMPTPLGTVEELQRNYITECLYRCCSFSGGAGACRTYEEFVGTQQDLQTATPPADFNIENSVLVKYIGSGGDVVVPDSVTSIEGGAFDRCTNLTSVTIPDGVTRIGVLAFNRCVNLTSVTIPDSVKDIGMGAFFGCSGLTNVSISSNVTYIDSNLFQDCTGLTSVTIPDSVTKISMSAFNYCTGIKDVYYAGTQAQWEEITIEDGNGSLINATVYYGAG